HRESPYRNRPCRKLACHPTPARRRAKGCFPSRCRHRKRQSAPWLTISSRARATDRARSGRSYRRIEVSPFVGLVGGIQVDAEYSRVHGNCKNESNEGRQCAAVIPRTGVPWLAVGDPVLLPSAQDKDYACRLDPNRRRRTRRPGRRIIDVMRCKSLVLSAAVVGAGSLPGPAGAEPACYELDPAHTTVAFLVEHA